MKTVTDLATMEGANEAARRAVNGLLSAEGRSDFCELFPLTEPLGFLREWDRRRFLRKLPQSPLIGVAGTLLGCGVHVALWTSWFFNGIIKVFRWIDGLPPRPGELLPIPRGGTAALPAPSRHAR